MPTGDQESEAGVEAIALNGGRNIWVAHGKDIDRSSDGGSTWQRLATLDELPRQLVVLDPEHLRVLGSCAIEFSDDAGKTWTVVPQPRSPLTHFSWSDDNHAMAVDSEHQLLRSHDGGLTWSRSAAPGPVVAVAATGPESGWISNAYGVEHTEDGGHWTREATNPEQPPPASGPETPLTFYDLQAAGPEVVYATAIGIAEASQEQHATYRISLAGGPNLLGDAGGTYSGLMSAIGVDSVALTGSVGGGGATELAIHSPTGTVSHEFEGFQLAQAMAFASSQNGWLSLTPIRPQAPALLHTIDGGEHWTVVRLPYLGISPPEHLPSEQPGSNCQI